MHCIGGDEVEVGERVKEAGAGNVDIELSGNLGERGVCGGEVVAWFRNIPKFLLCLFRLDRVVDVVSEDVTIDFVAYFNGQREQATLRDDGLRPG